MLQSGPELAPSWLVLIVSLPPRPSSLRVRAWRRLRALSAVPLKNSVYLLPDGRDHQEQFDWLAEAVQRDGGEATLFRIARIEHVAPAEVIRLFHEARDRDYAALAARYRRVLRGLDRKASARMEARRADELGRLSRERERLRQIDFFEAPSGREVDRLREAIEARRRPPEALAAPAPGLALAALRGRRWATRPRPHVDRLACAWLVRRFVDQGAAFPPDAVPFDVVGAEFGHQGEDCSFETLIRRAGLRDRRLRALAELVHEADLRDQKFDRAEAPGLDLVVRALLAALPDDQDVLAHGLVLFDGLYAALASGAGAPEARTTGTTTEEGVTTPGRARSVVGGVWGAERHAALPR